MSNSASPLPLSLPLLPLPFPLSPKAPPFPGNRWFQFNDAYVSPVLERAIQKMFQGKQSAYMLFYRSKSLARPEQGGLTVSSTLVCVCVCVCALG